MKKDFICTLGSVFRVITGNLYATDGEKYDKLIENLKRKPKVSFRKFQTAKFAFSYLNQSVRMRN